MDVIITGFSGNESFQTPNFSDRCSQWLDQTKNRTIKYVVTGQRFVRDNAHHIVAYSVLGLGIGFLLIKLQEQQQYAHDLRNNLWSSELKFYTCESTNRGLKAATNELTHQLAQTKLTAQYLSEELENKKFNERSNGMKLSRMQQELETSQTVISQLKSVKSALELKVQKCSAPMNVEYLKEKLSTVETLGKQCQQQVTALKNDLAKCSTLDSRNALKRSLDNCQKELSQKTSESSKFTQNLLNKCRKDLERRLPWGDKEWSKRAEACEDTLSLLKDKDLSGNTIDERCQSTYKEFRANKAEIIRIVNKYERQKM